MITTTETKINKILLILMKIHNEIINHNFEILDLL